MSGEQLASPFGTEPLDRIRLGDAPLVRVVAQLKYPSLAVLRDGSLADSFASRLGKEYPVLQEQRGVNLLLTPDGLAQQPSNQRILSLRSRDDLWKLTLADNFLALDTANYPKRKDFIDRFERAVEMLIELTDPPYFDRLGLRYVNRIDDLDLITGRLKNMIREELQGMLAVEHPDGVEIKHGLFDSLFSESDYAIQVRSGILPPQTVLDSEIQPVDRRTWVLDIDSYIEKRMPADTTEIAGQIRNLADRAYRVFRWIVNEDFIEHFRGAHG